MIASRVTPPVEEEGEEVDGVEGVGGAASMAHITWKWSEMRKGIGKWRKILVIAEGKMSLSRVVISLCTSMMERIK